MKTPEQLSMFEPEGANLATLAVFHLHTAEKFFNAACNLSMTGFMASAREHLRLSDTSYQSSFQCEVALQFEQLSGLS